MYIEINFFKFFGDPKVNVSLGLTVDLIQSNALTL